jgi:hypothetical protein
MSNKTTKKNKNKNKNNNESPEVTIVTKDKEVSKVISSMAKTLDTEDKKEPTRAEIKDIQKDILELSEEQKILLIKSIEDSLSKRIKNSSKNNTVKNSKNYNNYKFNNIYKNMYDTPTYSRRVKIAIAKGDKLQLTSLSLSVSELTLIYMRVMLIRALGKALYYSIKLAIEHATS